MRKYVLDVNADNVLADKYRSYIEPRKLGSAFEAQGCEAVLSLAELADVQPRIDRGALGKDWPDEDSEWQEL
jgi:hypothetical protein